MKNLYGPAALIALLISGVMIISQLFFSSGPLDPLVRFIGTVFLLIGMLLYQRAPKRVIDEREVRVSAKANQWGNLALLLYVIVLALIARDNPALVSVPVALFCALIADFGITAIAFQIMIRMPNADVDKWETK